MLRIIVLPPFPSAKPVSVTDLTQISADGGSTKFTCNVCFKQYSHKRNLRRHIQEVHVAPGTITSKSSAFVCRFCGKKFAFRSNGFRHERNVHGFGPQQACEATLPGTEDVASDTAGLQPSVDAQVNADSTSCNDEEGSQDPFQSNEERIQFQSNEEQVQLQFRLSEEEAQPTENYSPTSDAGLQQHSSENELRPLVPTSNISLFNENLQQLTTEELVLNPKMNAVSSVTGDGCQKRLGKKKKLKTRRSYVCGECHNVFHARTDFWKHIEEDHSDLYKQNEDLLFENDQDFRAWKAEMENETSASFVKAHKPYETVSCVVQTYMCNRSGKYISKSRGIRRVRQEKLCKIGAVCPAFIKYEQNKASGEVSIKFFPTHLGHGSLVKHTAKQSTMQTYSDVSDMDATTSEHYQKKISIISNVDPYSLDLENASTDAEEFPRCNLWTIGTYLVHRTCFYTNRDFVAFKSLESYSAFAVGWVRDVKVFIFDSIVHKLVVGKVMHSTRSKQKPFRVWIIASNEGEIFSAHCNCMSGSTDACTHVASLLFYIESVTKFLPDMSITDVQAYETASPSVQDFDMDH